MRALMVQGTGSDVGKSTVVAGLCRLARRRGIDVAPFKPQNMSNNAAVAADGGEIGRAQALQALAAGVEPSVHMNPVLLKPESDRRAQVVVQGRIAGSLDASRFLDDRETLLPAVLDSLQRLRARHDLILVEGAGSPAEVNLRARDIANMGFARAADVPVCLVGDIDRGGVIAALVGTQRILDADDAAMITGFCVNKFRGDPRLFDDGIDVIERTTGWPCLGVVPWLSAATRLPAEDAVALMEHARRPDSAASTTAARRPLRIVAPLLSRIANLDDADPLRLEPDVDFRFVPPGEPLPRDADVVILFGTKSTRAELSFLTSQGWHHDLLAHARTGGAVLGLCGGFQLLGRSIDDPDGHDGTPGHAVGLGLLEVETRMHGDKTVRHTDARCALSGLPVRGYEIHVGQTDGADRARPMLELDGRSDGARSADGRIEGSYLHGLFVDDGFRRAWLDRQRRQAGLSSTAPAGDGPGYAATVDAAIDAVADGLDAALDVDRLFAMARAPRSCRDR